MSLENILDKKIERLERENISLKSENHIQLCEINALREQLTLTGVGCTLPKKFSAAAYTQAITGNYEQFVKWWDER